ncbi:MAG: hypothetical protein GDA44_13760 [Prochloron sp. SP5CPC1]|nr:hypothetical protein [Candidatus Paraprochloron terpiosi SP5CPC1]
MAIKITNPTDNQEFSLEQQVTFQGTVDDPITQVELLADDRWPLGRTQLSGNWSISYAFNAAGNRLVVAKGFDAANNLVASDDIWVEISSSWDLSTFLTPNFQLWEFVVSPTAQRLGIDNTPTAREIENLRTLCSQILQPARNALGALKINSGFRSEALNLALRGSSTSAHRKGFAADVNPLSVGTRRFAEWVRNNCDYDQIILEFGTLANPDWIHVSAQPRNRKQVLRMDRSGTRFITLP